MLRGITALVGLLLLGATACGGSAPTPPSTPTPAVVLEKILSDCWGASQLRELDGTRPEHTRAFECARTRLLRMTRDYPVMPEPHRLLAWGYYFALQDEDAARAEYERAAEIYHAGGRPTEHSEMLVQLASLAFKYDHGRGCVLLQQANAVDPNNARAAQLLRNFACLAAPTPSPTPDATSG